MQNLPPVTSSENSLRSQLPTVFFALGLALVLVLAGYLRFSGSDWGELQHQHPDELFFTSVTYDIQPVGSDPGRLGPPPNQVAQPWRAAHPETYPDCPAWGGYFDTACSPLNPHNRGYSSYVYGTLPIFIVRYLAEWTGRMDNVKLLGRQLSAAADIGAILLLCLIAWRLYGRRTAVLAGIFSALTVMQIQQSHFYTSDMFANFFIFLAIYFSVVIATRKPRPAIAAAPDEANAGNSNRALEYLTGLVRSPDLWLSAAFGFALGMSVASKLNAAPLAILLPIAFGVRYLILRREAPDAEAGSVPPARHPALTVESILVYLAIGALFSLLAFRIFQPYAFSGPGFFGLRLNQQWISNIAEQRSQATGDSDLPWNLQWARRSHLFSFENLTVWGLGLPLGILAWIGFFWMGWRILKGEWKHLLLWSWTAVYFGWQSLQFNPTMRYQLPVYPLLAMMAAWFVFELARSGADSPRRFEPRKLAVWLIGALVLGATLVWAFAFASIYVRPEPRIAASDWIYANIPGPISVPIQKADGTSLNVPLPFTAGALVGQGSPYDTAFTAPVSGTAKEIVFGHVADTILSGPQTLRASMALAISAPADQILGSGTVTRDFLPPPDARGASVTLTLDPPVKIEKGQVYFVHLEASGGALLFSGASFTNETDYDYPLPFRVDGYDAFGGIYRGDLNLQVYWDDNADKLTRFENTLSQSDYILIPTNHQYGQITRLPERYPLTTVYYRELLGCPPQQDIIACYRVAEPGTYKGRLGFELVATFEDYPTLGPLVINDQSAEEAFTFYDHPKVMIFKKQASYDPQQVAAVLGAVDLSRVVHLTPGQANNYKDLMLPADRLAVQLAGGTWSQLFNPDALYNRYPVLGLILWYLTIFVLGVFTYPIVRLAFPGLADKGYPLARIVGLVLWAWLAWIAGSFEIPYSRLTIGLMYALIVVAGAALAWRQRDELRAEWQSRRRYFLMIEGLFLSLYLIDTFIRLGNPDLWHPAKGGERPMDFSYFNAVLKSTTFPPYDPWFAGGYINYYYYGYVIVGTPVKLLGIVPTIAYNFILPMLYAILGVCGFSVAWNIMAAVRPEGEDPAESFRLQFYAGMGAVSGLILLGNLGVVRMIYQGFQRLTAPGGVIDNPVFPQGPLWALSGLLKWFGGAQLPYGPGDWYWFPSRVIPAPNDVEPITEFPLFTFLYSDLHAHMIAFALTVVVIAWALSVLLAKARWPGRLSMAVSFFIGAQFIGVLYPTNTWDFPTYLALAALVLGYAVFRYADVEGVLPEFPRVGKRLAAALLGMFVLAVLSLLLYQPFTQWFGQGYTQVQKWFGSHTPMWSYFSHWGLFLFVIISWMIWETGDWLASTPVSSLHKLRPYQIAIEVGLVLVGAGVLALILLDVSIGWLVLPLAVWAGVLMFRPGLPDVKRLVLFMVGTGLTLTLVVELIVLVGDIGRMNTVFKFYLQVWTLFAISAAAAFGWLVPALARWRASWRSSWQVAVWLLVFGAALFPLMGGFDKIRDRMAPETPHVFDSMTYMDYAHYADQGVDMDLSEDYRAIHWMQENVQGSPVIVEANCPEYRWCTRFTIYTGLPGVVGWNWHQRQQRTLMPQWVEDRVAQVGDFYNNQDIGQSLAFLKQYDVTYIIVGQLERAFYPEPGLAKFDTYNGKYWQEVYREGQTVIYRVLATQ